MILLPLGHEQQTVKQLPLVTFTIMGVCALVFVMTTFGTPHDESADYRFSEAIEYFFEHPWLEPDPELVAMLGADGDDELFAAQIEVLREMSKPEPGTDRAAQQAELDRLTGQAFAALDSHPYHRYGLVPGRVRVTSLVTHMFLHGGWLHLIGNMLFLYLGGPFVEDRWGRLPFAGFYLLSGFAAAALHMANFPGSDVPMIGASGAIAGVMGAFLICFATTRIEFFYFVWFSVRGTFEAPAWIMLPLWFAQQLFFATMTSGLADGGGVGYWAHVGGFAFGALAALAIVHSGFEERVLAPAVEARAAGASLTNPAVEEASRARDAGDTERAWTLLLGGAGSRPGEPDTATALWDVAVETGREAEAAPYLLAAVDRSLRDGDRETALRLWFEAVGRIPRLSADPGLLLRVADACGDAGRGDWRHDAARRVLLLPEGLAGPLQLVRATAIAGTAEPDLARRALGALVQRADLHPEERASVTEALEALHASGPAA